MPQEELTPEQEETVKEALRLASLSSAADSEDGTENAKNLPRSADKKVNNNKIYDKNNTNKAEDEKPPSE
jgi:hypothetical protein